MHTVIMQVHNGTQLKALLDYLQTVGIGRVIFPGRECVGEDTRRLVPIAPAADRAGSHRPVGQYSGQATPFDESPTVVILDRRRTTMKQHNGRIPTGANAADVVEQAARRWGFHPMSPH